MKAEIIRFMWLMLFFDLPVGTKAQRHTASRFRTMLKKEGFMMLQYSVYARICRGQDGADKYMRRIKGQLPEKGSIRSLQITDKQFARMELLVGSAGKNEKIGPSQMVLL